MDDRFRATLGTADYLFDHRVARGRNAGVAKRRKTAGGKSKSRSPDGGRGRQHAIRRRNVSPQTRVREKSGGDDGLTNQGREVVPYHRHKLKMHDTEGEGGKGGAGDKGKRKEGKGLQFVLRDLAARLKVAKHSLRAADDGVRKGGMPALDFGGLSHSYWETIARLGSVEGQAALKAAKWLASWEGRYVSYLREFISKCTPGRDDGLSAVAQKELNKLTSRPAPTGEWDDSPGKEWPNVKTTSPIRRGRSQSTEKKRRLAGGSGERGPRGKGVGEVDAGQRTGMVLTTSMRAPPDVSISVGL